MALDSRERAKERRGSAGAGASAAPTSPKDRDHSRPFSSRCAAEETRLASQFGKKIVSSLEVAQRALEVLIAAAQSLLRSRNGPVGGIQEGLSVLDLGFVHRGRLRPVALRSVEEQNDRLTSGTAAVDSPRS